MCWVGPAREPRNWTSVGRRTVASGVAGSTLPLAHRRNERARPRRHSLAAGIYQPKPGGIVGCNGSRPGRNDPHPDSDYLPSVQPLVPAESGLPPLPSLGLGPSSLGSAIRSRNSTPGSDHAAGGAQCDTSLLTGFRSPKAQRQERLQQQAMRRATGRVCPPFRQSRMPYDRKGVRAAPQR